jgi:hypothetical protein
MRNVNWIGLLVCGVCVVASLGISVQYGMSIAQVWWHALLYSSIGVASVIGEVLAAHRIAHLWRSGRGVAMTAYICGGILASFITIQYEMGYLADLFEGNASAGESRAGNRSSLEHERRTLEAQLEKAGIVRPVPAIEGDIAGIKAHPRWTSSRGCTDVTAPESKELCANYGKLSGEMGTAMAIKQVHSRVRDINAELHGLSGAKVADARASYMAQLTGTTEMGARVTLTVLIIVFLWWGRTFAPFVFVDPPAAEKPQTPIAPEKPIEARTAPEAVAAPDVAAEVAFLPPSSALVDESYDSDDEGMTAEEVQALWEIEQEREAIAALSGKKETLPDNTWRKGALPPTAEEVLLTAGLDASDPTYVFDRNQIDRFAASYLSFRPGDRNACESVKLVWDAFQQWCTDMEIGENQRMNRQRFAKVFPVLLAENGGGRAKRSEMFYFGVVINPAPAHRLATATALPLPLMEDFPMGAPVNGERRLGGALVDRMGLVAS